MRIEFNTDVDFNGLYELDENGKLAVEVKAGKVNIEYLPTLTTEELKNTEGECNTYAVSTEDCTYDWDSENTDEFQIDVEIDKEEDEFYELAKKISEYDRSGRLTSILAGLISENDNLSDKVASNISKIILNLSDTLKAAKEKMQEICTDE